MDEDLITIRLPPDLRDGLSALAQASDLSLGLFVAQVLGREVARARAVLRPRHGHDRKVAQLRARLGTEFAQATSWTDLQARLAARGHALREASGGLALHDWPGDHRLCAASELGFSYGRLLSRFGAPFPGHVHTWQFDRLVARPPDAADEKEGSGEDIAAPGHTELLEVKQSGPPDTRNRPEGSSEQAFSDPPPDLEVCGNPGRRDDRKKAPSGFAPHRPEARAVLGADAPLAGHYSRDTGPDPLVPRRQTLGLAGPDPTSMAAETAWLPGFETPSKMPGGFAEPRSGKSRRRGFG